jgi:hypothetical protein
VDGRHATLGEQLDQAIPSAQQRADLRQMALLKAGPLCPRRGAPLDARRIVP